MEGLINTGIVGLVISWILPALSLVLFLLVLLFLCYCIYVKHMHLKFDHIPGPPRDSFFLGHKPTLYRVMKEGGVTFSQFLEWAEVYGPVFKINTLHHVIVCVTCPETTKEVLMSSKYPKDKLFYRHMAHMFGGRFFGSGVLTVLDHGEWYRQRRILDPAFSSTYLRSLTSTFNESAEKITCRLSEAADRKSALYMLDVFNCFTLDVIAKVGFNVDLDLTSQGSPFPDAIKTCLEGLLCSIRDPFVQLRPASRVFIRKVTEARRLLRATGSRWIRERVKAMKNGDNVPKDILTQIIKSADHAGNLTSEDEEMMVDNFVTFFVAGQETTANQLSFCLMELSRRPDVLRRVRREVDEVIGARQEISADDLSQLTYLSQVLKETLRLYPTAPATSREVHQDVCINGVHVPGGFIGLFSTFVTGRMSMFFEDPLVFDPDRFHPDAPKPYYCYYPFALGPRSCLGKNLAEMESKVVMAKLIQRFDFLLTPGQSLDIMDTGTLRPKSSVHCSVRHRDE